jgi:hypothetical protein
MHENSSHSIREAQFIYETGVIMTHKTKREKSGAELTQKTVFVSPASLVLHKTFGKAKSIFLLLLGKLFAVAIKTRTIMSLELCISASRAPRWVQVACLLSYVKLAASAID